MKIIWLNEKSQVQIVQLQVNELYYKENPNWICTIKALLSMDGQSLRI